MIEKLNAKIEELQEQKQKILNDLKEGKTPISTNNIIKIGQELEVIRCKIWTIEETIAYCSIHK